MLLAGSTPLVVVSDWAGRVSVPRRCCAAFWAKAPETTVCVVPVRPDSGVAATRLVVVPEQAPDAGVQLPLQEVSEICSPLTASVTSLFAVPAATVRVRLVPSAEPLLVTST